MLEGLYPRTKYFVLREITRNSCTEGKPQRGLSGRLAERLLGQFQLSR